MSRSLGAEFFRGSKRQRSSTNISSELLQPSPARHDNRSLCTSSRPSFFLFSVFVGLCCRFLRSSSLVLSLLSGTGFSEYLLTSNTESCDEHGDEIGVAVVEELVDKPGTTNGT